MRTARIDQKMATDRFRNKRQVGCIVSFDGTPERLVFFHEDGWDEERLVDWVFTDDLADRVIDTEGREHTK